MLSNYKEAILVTGGAGYIGSHTVLSLLEQKQPVIILDDLSTGNISLVPENSLFYEGSIADSSLVSAIIKTHNVKKIIHFAGSTIVPESVSNPIKYYNNNTFNTACLIDIACKYGVKQFLFSSTAAVYGVPLDKKPVTEKSLLKPINPYGRSKLMTEMMLRDVANISDMKVGILRYFNVAGADPKGRSGQLILNATHLIKVACEVALGKRSHIDIFGTDFDTPDGSGVRDFIHVSDLAQAHIDLLKYLNNVDHKVIVPNCGYGIGYSVKEIIAAVQKISGNQFTVNEVDRRLGDPASVVASSEYLRREIGWKPLYDNLDFIIKSVIDWENRF